MATHHLFLLLLVLLGAHDTLAAERPRRQFSRGLNPSFAADGSSKGTLDIEIKKCPKDLKIANAKVRCGYSGCRVVCLGTHKIPSGERTATLRCDHSTGNLTFSGLPWEPSLTACLPYCGVDGCHQGGKCIEPGECECLPGTSGEHCEIAVTPPQEENPDPPQEPERSQKLTTCPDPKFPVVNAAMQREGELLLVRCSPGHIFPIGGTIAYVKCHNGAWDKPAGIFSVGGAFACQKSTCNPPCQNGGQCMPEGVCDCPGHFWGPVCQLKMCRYPTHLTNAALGGRMTRMKIRCHPKHKMASGRRWLTILCINGEWKISGQGLLKDTDVNCYPEDQLAQKS